MRIEVLLDVKTTLGEGPVWDVDQQRLYFIDSMDGRFSGRGPLLPCQGVWKSRSFSSLQK